jgi:FdhD protein
MSPAEPKTGEGIAAKEAGASLAVPVAATALPAEVTILRRDAGVPQPSLREIAVEVPVNVVYDNVPYAVMMMTPADLDDFAHGFSLTEGVIAAREDILGTRAEAGPRGMKLFVELVDRRYRQVLDRRRAMTGRTGCGVCGIEDLSSVPRAVRRPSAPVEVRAASIWRALQALAAHQVLNAATMAVHAAAWAGPDGDILCVREDVGRHNALDKLIGALLRQGAPPTGGFLLVTSRCSYEMVEKAAAFGAGALVAISAPTSMGIERARHHGMTLIGIARGDAMTVFTGPVPTTG